MIFPSVNGIERPIRLSESTRRFAYESIQEHRWGKDTKKNPAVVLDPEQLEGLSPIEQYDLAIRTIAEDAPIRICEGEKLSGAATLGLGIEHLVPATSGGAALFGSISHLTIDFETTVKYGTDSIRKRAEQALETFRGTGKEPFSKSCLNCLDALDIYHERYLEALRDRPEYADNYKNLLQVPKKPATSFYEAVQSIWFLFSFVRLCGNWPGIGRIDALLGPYLEKDLKDGVLTLDEAREILAHFFIKGCEWVSGEGPWGSGDAQHYQNLVLAGVDASGKDVTNPVTYLILDVIEETGISDFPTTVRLSKNTPDVLLNRIAEVMRFGGGILAVYNEELILESLTSYGYSKEEAVLFANDGCWEVQIPGKTNFGYSAFDSLQVLQTITLNSYESVSFASYEELYTRYIEDLTVYMRQIEDALSRKMERRDPDGTWVWKPTTPCTVVSLFEHSCIEKGLSYREGGADYNVESPHIGGLADTVNFLYALKKLVFDEQKIGFDDFMTVLKNNWEGEESLRRYVSTKYDYYGNDSDEVDAICARLLHDFSIACSKMDGKTGYSLPGGVSTFGRQLEWSPRRLACAHGRRAHEVLAANASPTPGTEKSGATAIIKSYCKADLTKQRTGAALDIGL
ncbi:MAG: hypothetical protein J5938_01555, partial [Clostridia bacterium]|nr:hypothetical protein [Clostridia bacterium]